MKRFRTRFRNSARKELRKIGQEIDETNLEDFWHKVSDCIEELEDFTSTEACLWLLHCKEYPQLLEELGIWEPELTYDALRQRAARGKRAILDRLIRKYRATKPSREH